MKKIGEFIKSGLIDRITIDVGVFIVFFLVTILFVFTLFRSF